MQIVSPGNILFSRTTLILFFIILFRFNLYSADQFWDKDDGNNGASTGTTATGIGVPVIGTLTLTVVVPMVLGQMVILQFFLQGLTRQVLQQLPQT